MGLFSKKEKKNENEIPELPQLPKLPDLPDIDDYSNKKIHQLPSFPLNPIGTKFSRDTIKDAISGENRGDEDFYEKDFSDDEMRRIQEPLRRPNIEEVGGELEEGFSRKLTKTSSGGFKEEIEPVFVRIDKFEESLRLFETVKDQVSAIERNLAEIKRVKEKEEAELNSWESELKKMREEIDRIGLTIFSKV